MDCPFYGKIAGEGSFGVNTKRYFADHSVGGNFLIFHVYFEILNVDRVDVVNRFRNFGKTIFDRFIETNFGGSDYLDDFYDWHKIKFLIV